jgi:hypothetical protein
VLQWWDPAEKCTINTRIDGDLVTAIAQAREIDDRLVHSKSSGITPRKVSHAQLVSGFVADLQKRADAGEIDVATASRYESALRHFQDFTAQAHLAVAHRSAAGIDREFQLQFAAYLDALCVIPNGRSGALKRPMRGQSFVLDVVRSMLEWAADPERGNFLPESFRNPFAHRARGTRNVATDPIRPLDVTTSMAVDLVRMADRFQLAVFAPLLLYGLRPGELGWLFTEHVRADWLNVPNVLELDYTTKGRRDKRFPLTASLRSLWQFSDKPGCGLIYVTRAASEGRVRPPLFGLSLSGLSEELRRRCAVAASKTAAGRRRVRDQLMKEAGQLCYDHVEGEFQQLARRLNWPDHATLKDFRHLFSTCLQNAGIPELYRRYFMGHAFGKAPIVAYSHVTEDKVHEHYQRALDTELAPIVRAIEKHVDDLHLQPLHQVERHVA